MLPTRSATSLSLDAVARVKLWPAYLLAVLCPGAGHLYARHWARGLCWVTLYGTALVFFSAGALLLGGGLADLIVVSALRLEGIVFAEVVVPLAIFVCSVLDLYLLVALDNV